MTIGATFAKTFRREAGRQTRPAPGTKRQVATKPKQEQNGSTAAKPIPSTPEPLWKAYGLDVSETALD
jgi:hypothetical protein